MYVNQTQSTHTHWHIYFVLNVSFARCLCLQHISRVFVRDEIEGKKRDGRELVDVFFYHFECAMKTVHSNTNQFYCRNANTLTYETMTSFGHNIEYAIVCTRILFFFHLEIEIDFSSTFFVAFTANYRIYGLDWLHKNSNWFTLYRQILSSMETMRKIMQYFWTYWIRANGWLDEVLGHNQDIDFYD